MSFVEDIILRIHQKKLEFGDVNINVENYRIVRYITLLLISASIYVIYKMTSRSVWVDEATLLKNMFEAESLSQFIQPLQHYNQAQPLLASVFYKSIVTYVSEDFRHIRLFISPIFLIFIFNLNSIVKDSALRQAVLFLVVFANVYNLGFYFTEIKHYSLEILSSSLMLYGLHLYYKTHRLIAPAAIVIASLPLGFSTLIPGVIILSYIFLTEYRKKILIRSKHLIGMILCSIFVIGITYLHMTILTVYQIGNYETYMSKGLFNDLIKLIVTVTRTYGFPFIIASALATIYSLKSTKNTFLFKLNIIFILITFAVLAGKLTGAYPVTSPKHLAWILPFSIVITTLAISNSLETYKTRAYFAFALLAIITVLSLSAVSKISTNNYPELTANNQLYNYVSQLEKTVIVVHPTAQPTLQYYSMLIPALNKHKFYGRWDSKSKKNKVENLISYNSRFARLLNSTFVIPEKNYYYLLSNSLPIEDIHNFKINELRNKFSNSDCTYSIAFSDNRVQLLKVSCNYDGAHSAD
jgi:hypothetical protein